MGFESYNLRLTILEDGINESYASNIFHNMGYHFIGENADKIILEKSLASGFIEISINGNEISMRTAKANNEQIIFKMIEDIIIFNKKVKISVFDYQTGQELIPSNASSTSEKFSHMRNEFLKYYPCVNYPIRCDDIWKDEE